MQPPGFWLPALESCSTEDGRLAANRLPSDDHLFNPGGKMETYVILFNYTEQGLKNAKNIPDRVAAVRAAVEKTGGKWIGWYMTMGQYDGVVIVQAPNVNVAAALIMATGMQGNVHTETMRAFSVEEVQSMMASMP
jgi:uncharacterized protein with GYD domain